jgi:predicted Zn finger-like uncharacterized protein
MLIQCQTCATRYRVDLERLPRRKTFVRCKTCGTPIYLDPTAEDDAPEAAPLEGLSGPVGMSGAGESGASSEGLAIHGGGSTGGQYIPAAGAHFAAADSAAPDIPAAPSSGAFQAADGVPVQCPHCQSRYRVPAAPLLRPNIKLKCSVCGHIFAPAQAVSREFFAGAVVQERMDTLFDGLTPPSGVPIGPGPAGARLTDSAVNRLQSSAPPPDFPPGSEADPELAYLDAVALDADEIPRPTGKKVPDDQKYQLFLKPDAFRVQRDSGQRDAGPSESPDSGSKPPPRSPPPRTGATPAQADSPKAVWPEHGSDDDFLEIEFFEDDDPASPDYIKPLGGTWRPPERTAAGSAADTAGEMEDFAQAAKDTVASMEESGEVAEEAAILGALDLPPLDDEEEFPVNEEPVAEAGIPDLMDIEPLPPLEAEPPVERQPPPKAPAPKPPAGPLPGDALPEIELEDIGTGSDAGMSIDNLPPLEDSANPAPTAASADMARLDHEVDTADLPLDAELPFESPDIDLDLDTPVRPAASLGEGEDSFDFGPLSEEPLDSAGPPPPLSSSDTLPPLEDLPPLPSLDDVPELDLAAAAASAPSVQEPAPVPAVAPAARKQKAGKEPAKRLMIAGQSGWLTNRRRALTLVVVAGVLVGAMIAWGSWLMRDPTKQPFAFEFEKVHQLALQEDLQGRYVTNRGGQRYFVVEGQLVNRFPKSVKISWVRVRGTIYADRAQGQVIGATQAYLGNVLTQQQLETWDPKAIAAFGAYNNGRKNINLDIPPLEVVPFQLAFPDPKTVVERTVVQVISYTRNGLAVYVDAPVGGGR